MTQRLRVQVTCYEGYKGAERPFEFRLGERVYIIRAVLDQWYEPDSTYFKVKVDDGNVYILKRSRADEWTIESFRREEVQ